MAALSPEELRAAFDEIDADGSGQVDAGELERLFTAIFKDNTPEEVKEMAANAASMIGGTDNKISYGEFEKFIQEQMKS